MVEQMNDDGDWTTVLIETYWNVNVIIDGIRFLTLKVLIETYWNVNFYHRTGAKNGNTVLIETYWNVNFYRMLFVAMYKQRLNRNILECKYSNNKD